MTRSPDPPRPRTLKARYVFPVSGEPVPGGIVTIQGERFVAVGREPARGDAEDLGNVAILPGLINAHTHLEFSDLPGPLGEPGMGLTDWIRRAVEARRRAVETARRPVPVEQGLRECVGWGTTSLGEIAQPGWASGPFEKIGLHATVFLELIAPTANRVGPALESARQHLEKAAAPDAWRPGLSPHAPYSVHPELLRGVVDLSAKERVPIAFHLAESREELELLRSGAGPFRDLLTGLGAWDPTAFRPGARPLDYLTTLSAADRTLIVHGNYLDDEEIAFLATHADRMAVVYCPRTHAYFGHPPYPLTKLLSAGATVALGTDSRASAPDLSVLAEMRFVARHHEAVAPEVVLQLGTIRAARALGRDQEVGTLEPGKYADLAVVALPDRAAADPHELLFHSDQPVVATWHKGVVSGEW